MNRIRDFLLYTTLAAAASQGASALMFDAATREFRQGDKAVSVGGVVAVKTGGRRQLLGGWMASTPYRMWMKPKRFLDRKIDVDAKTGTVRFQARIPLTKDGRTAGFTQVSRLTSDGLIDVRVAVTFDDPGDRTLCKGGFFQFIGDVANLAGERVRAGDKVITFADWRRPKGDKVTRLFETRNAWVTFYPDAPARSFALKPVVGRLQLIDYRLIKRDSYVELRAVPKGDVAEFLIKLPKTPGATAVIRKTYAGIDFFRCDGFNVPNYELSRNLIQNPSFEAGFHYWSPVNCHPPVALDFNDFAVIDDNVAFRGHRSLRLKVRKGQAPPLVAHFAVPVVPGKTYTFSFYAKADRPKVKTSVLAVTGDWGDFPISKRIELTTEWKRYSFACKAPNRLLHIGVGERWWDNRENSGQINGASIWFDCVQLEEGELTDYAEKPVVAELVTGQYANTFDVRQPREMDFAVHNLTGEPRDVAVTLSIKDFFGRRRYREQFTLSMPAHGRASRHLSLTRVLTTGFYVFRARLADGKFADTDYFRVCVIRALSNTHRNKDLCGVHFRRPFWFDKTAEFLMRTGIGSGIGGGGRYFGPFPGKAYYDILAKYRIKALASIFALHVKAGDLSLSKKEAYTPEGRARVEAACYERAKSMPYVKYWKLINEPEANGFPGRLDGVSMKDLVETLKAAYRGIKRATLRAVVISPDPCNMYERGRSWIGRFIRAGGLQACDIIAIHIYRPAPEDPDLDADARHLFAMLDSLGYKGPVWWTEGIYYAPYTIADLDISAYKTISDHYRCGALSYDLGRSERIAAARTARSYLVGFKYGRRLGMIVDWSRRYRNIDFDDTPGAYLFAQNTLGNLLGNADYRQDVDLGFGVRTYVFENEKQQPVAVMWNYNPKVERFEKPAPKAVLTFKPGEVHAFDFMMNEVPAAGRSKLELAVTPYPLFLIGTPGSLKTFVGKLAETRIEGAEQKPFRVATRVEGSQAEITFTSLLSRGVKGRYAIRLGEKTVDTGALDIAGRGEKKVLCDLTSYIQPGAIALVPLAVQFKEAAGTRTVIDGSFRLGVCPRRHLPIAIDGKLDDWESIPGVRLGKDNLTFFGHGPNTNTWHGASDLSATLKTAWDETGFFLAVDVADNVLDLKGRYKKRQRVWFMRDSLQVYFDTWADARFRRERGYDNNDYAYQFALTPEGPRALRDTVPEWQIAFLKTGAPETVETAIRRVGNHTIYEIFLPKREIVPIRLVPGTSFGFAILVNDKDNDYRKQGLTLTPAGTEPYMNPQLWPLWVLGK
ncbi:MAG: hypothetical protein GXP31_08240 [Kiritimatiellaeota bacterium]|nr:hypothetical protein [Kiritimatiellota bacterium]